ncbi:hypothetical protein IJ596_06575 [bacterium]|nr:hypothetical protein [bacterium]
MNLSISPIRNNVIANRQIAFAAESEKSDSLSNDYASQKSDFGTFKDIVEYKSGYMGLLALCMALGYGAAIVKDNIGNDEEYQQLASELKGVRTDTLDIAPVDNTGKDRLILYKPDGTQLVLNLDGVVIEDLKAANAPVKKPFEKKPN